MKSTHFYSSIPCFDQLSEFTDDKHFCEVPEDWSVIVTNAKKSALSEALADQKEVNMVGAATIVVARKIISNFEFPFVYRGEGATILVPNEFAEEICKGLNTLKSMALKNHGLDLHVALVPHLVLLGLGKGIKVGKLEITPGNNLAILKGEGIAYVENIAKENDGRFQFHKGEARSIDLAGLSCRWNPIPSRKGKILTVLVHSCHGESVYDDFMQELAKIIPEGIEHSNPTNVELASYMSVKDILKKEKKLHSSLFSLSFIMRAIEIVVAVLIFKYKVPPIFFSRVRYSQSMRTHADFKKFSGMLRMVIDCTPAQIQAIETYLQKKFEAQQLYYSTLQADRVLMVCYVDGLGQGQHIHFIDAEDGGYATAFAKLELQMKSRGAA